jgi:hypothetical protein
VSLCVFGRYAPFEATILSIALAKKKETQILMKMMKTSKHSKRRARKRKIMKQKAKKQNQRSKM